MKLLQAGLLQLILVCCLTGCTTLAFMADDRRSLGEFTEDTTITSSVYVKYVADDLVEALDIKVDTFRGVVTLDGLVENQEAATRAIEIALRTRHVTRVISNLTIRTQALSLRGVVYE